MKGVHEYLPGFRGSRTTQVTAQIMLPAKGKGCEWYVYIDGGKRCIAQSCAMTVEDAQTEIKERYGVEATVTQRKPYVKKVKE